MRSLGIVRLVQWRWAPCAGLLVGSLGFVLLAVALIPDKIDTLTSEARAAHEEPSTLGNTGATLRSSSNEPSSASDARRRRSPPVPGAKQSSSEHDPIQGLFQPTMSLPVPPPDPSPPPPPPEPVLPAPAPPAALLNPPPLNAAPPPPAPTQQPALAASPPPVDEPGE